MTIVPLLREEELCESDRFPPVYSGRTPTGIHPSSRKMVEVVVELNIKNGTNLQCYTH